MLKHKRYQYDGPGGPFEGELIWDDAVERPRPCVLVAHAFGGESDFERGKATDLARLGYVGFAIDMYGKGRRASSPAQAQALMDGLNANRTLLAQRISAALDAARVLDQVDQQQIAAIGFCFGGKCVLDLARSGAVVKAAVSIHGVYDPPDYPSSQISAPILVLHGWQDPLGPPQQVLQLADELTNAKADWQLLALGGIGHAFTQPRAQAPERGMQYNALASERAWRATTAFLAERFAIDTHA